MRYEAGTILSAGAVMNVGDQCHPRGILDKGAYEVIGSAFRHVEACEPWCRGARPASEIGVVMLPDESSSEPRIAPAVDGAGRMLLEMKHQFDLIFPDTDLRRYRLVILPDGGLLSAEARRALAGFLKAGGRVVLSHAATLRGGQLECPRVPVRYLGLNPSKPSYMDYGSDLGKGLPESLFVMYEDSSFVAPSAGAKTFGALWSSYFNRAYDRFCSHSQTPYDRRTDHPVAVMKGAVGYLAPAVFTAYRWHAYPVYKAAVARLLEKLLPDPLVRTGAPSAMEISVHRQGKPQRMIAHLVNFQPQRRHIDVEWIEELYPVRDIRLSLRTGGKPTRVYAAPEEATLSFQMNGPYCEVTVPEVRAHQMVVFDGV
jgi:hypothetical protein